MHSLLFETSADCRRITLSGGQKQRVSLARALYSKARHLLLDDCLSAVDSHTAKWIFENALTGSLVQDRTRILVTHNVSLCVPDAAHVVILDNGRISEQGLPETLIEKGVLGEDDEALKKAVSSSNSAAASRAPSRVASHVQISDIVEEQEGLKAEAAKTKKIEDREAKANLTQEESRAQGSVQWKVYGSYMSSLGGPCFWISFGLALLSQQGLNVLQTYWIREWASSYQVKSTIDTVLSTYSRPSSQNAVVFSLPSTFHALRAAVLQDSSIIDLVGSLKKSSDLNYYLGIHALIALTYCVATFVRIVIVSFGSIRASQFLHEKLLEKVLRSKIRFFDSTPLGRILNR